jgi:isocitrate dehydrogenase
MAAKKVVIPAGDKVTIEHGERRVPDYPIIAHIEGDGIGPAIIQNMARL